MTINEITENGFLNVICGDAWYPKGLIIKVNENIRTKSVSQDEGIETALYSLVVLSVLQYSDHMNTMHKTFLRILSWLS